MSKKQPKPVKPAPQGGGTSDPTPPKPPKKD